MGGGLSLITVFTDAGWCPFIKRGSYAVWAKMDGKTFRKAGLLRGQLDAAHVAELRAIANGIASVAGFFKPPIGTKIILQTDCKGMINALLGSGYKKPKARKTISSELKIIQELLHNNKLQIEYRHVKGHQGYKNIRTAVNTWCDEECRRFLLAARAEAKKEKA